MSVESPHPAPSKLFIEGNTYIQDRLKDITMSDVIVPTNRFNALVYQQKEITQSSNQRNSNLILLPGVLGEAATTTHVSTSFLSGIRSVDTVMGFNASLSRTSLETNTYNHDLDEQADEIVALYKAGMPESKQGQPVILVGHSMSGNITPIVAKKLLRQGIDVSKIFLIAPPLEKRTKRRMLRNITELKSRRRIYTDIPVIYPSPADIAEIKERYWELAEKPSLTVEEREEMAGYELAVQRFVNPDELILSTMTPAERDDITQLDRDISFLLDPEEPRKPRTVARLQRARRKKLVRPVNELLVGKVNSEPIQQPLTSNGFRRAARNLYKSTGEIWKTIGDLAGDTTVESLEALIAHNNTIPDHRLDVTVITGSTDPFPGRYKTGRFGEILRRETEDAQTTLSEIRIPNFDHFTILDDSSRVAQIIDRIVEDQAA